MKKVRDSKLTEEEKNKRNKVLVRGAIFGLTGLMLTAAASAGVKLSTNYLQEIVCQWVSFGGML